MDKKFIYIAGGGLLLVVILIVVLVAVSNGSKNKTETIAKDTVMTIWDYNNEKPAYDQVILAYQQFKNIKINYVNKNIDTYLEDAVSAIAAGNGPDVWIIPSDIMPKYKDKLVPMPTGGFARSNEKKNDIEVYKEIFPEIVSQNNIFDNKIYGVPITVDPLKMYVNGTVIDKVIEDYSLAHPDVDTTNYKKVIYSFNTWDQLVVANKLITSKNGTKINRSGVALGTSGNIPTSTDILTLIMMQNGAKMTSDDLSTAQFHTAQNLFGSINYPGTKALEFYSSFADPKSDNYSWNSSMPNQIRAFAENKVGIIFDYNTAKKEIANIAPNLQYETMDLPQVSETKNPVNISKADTMVVTKSSKIPLIAWRFILMAASKDNTGNYTSITKKTLAANNIDKEIINSKGWYNPDPNKVKTIFDDVISQVNKGNDAQTALDGAASQITTLLGKLKQ